MSAARSANGHRLVSRTGVRVAYGGHAWKRCLSSADLGRPNFKIDIGCGVGEQRLAPVGEAWAVVPQSGQTCQ